MKKNGFTLSELLISMAIMGVLMGAAISTFKAYDKGIKHLYSNTYYVLDRALYNTMSYWVPNDIASREPFASSVLDVETNNTIQISDTEGTRRLCRALIEYINPVGDRDTLCSANHAVDDSGADGLFTDDNVQFTAVNGVRYWISRRYPAEGNDMRFFIIYADLNGNKRPNSMTYEPGSQANNWKTKDPDIFAFAALENGRVCPLGIAEVEPRYLTTRIVYQEAGEANEILLRYSTPSRPYVFSKAEAWGYYLPEERVPMGQNVVQEDTVLEDEPLSYNGYIKSRISEASNIYSFLNGQSMQAYMQATGIGDATFRSELPRHSEENPNGPNIGGYGCQWMSDEECYVIVDKYVE